LSCGAEDLSEDLISRRSIRSAQSASCILGPAVVPVVHSDELQDFSQE
jgi:hypothetical protein